MKIVWLPQARANRTDAIDHIAKENLRAAVDQLGEIERQSDLLANYPEWAAWDAGPAHELVINRTPFILVYRVQPKTNRIEILRLLHGARKWA